MVAEQEYGATAYIAVELTEALKPVVGSWEWALEQMKAEGKVRTHDMIAGAYLELCPDGFIHCEMPDDEDGKGFTFDIGDFSETCWQLATPSTAESTAPGPRQGLQE